MMLPTVLALIRLNGISAVSALVVIGLAYLLNALVYRLPLPVQPLKSLTSTALALGLSAATITAGSWWMAAIFLLLSLTGIGDRLQRLFPLPVVRGIQLSLGMLLLRMTYDLIQPLDPVLLVGSVALLLVLLKLRPEWSTLAVIAFGVITVVLQRGFPAVETSLSLPALTFPSWADFWPALWLLAIPQVPLSLGNSVYATADTARQYFGDQAAHVTPRRLLGTMGLANVAAALFGGVPVCHGSSGLTAHYRLGARSGGAPLMLGALFLISGILGSGFLLPILELIPFTVFGVLLAYIGISHSLLVRELQGWREWLPALAVAAVTWFTRNLAYGYITGLAIYFILSRLHGK